ncbi:CoA-transferase [Streptomyces showdoensis]|uniref:CoA-transferase n=1 Tax=Streptomyces showdoensis TaxID=68268 RepID=UPI003CD09A0C
MGGFGLSGVPNVPHPGAARTRASAAWASSPTTAGPWTPASPSCSSRAASPASPARTSGANKEFARQYLGGELDGRADPAGHPRRTPPGRRLRHHPPSTPPLASAPRSPTADCPGATTARAGSRSPPRRRRCGSSTASRTSWSAAIRTDFALVRAAKGDRHGNLVFHASARNFNPLAAMAGRITVRRGRGNWSNPAPSTPTGSTSPGSSSNGSSPSPPPRPPPRASSGARSPRPRY